jgi:hypothetical protein
MKFGPEGLPSNSNAAADANPRRVSRSLLLLRVRVGAAERQAVRWLMSILRRGVNIVLALVIVGAAWGVVVWLLASIPGTPHSQISDVIGATVRAQSDEGLQRFLDHGARVQAWNAVATALLGGVAIGLASRKWFHFRPLDIAAIVVGIALFKGDDYALCCVDRWDFVGPILLGTVTLITAGVNRQKPPNSTLQPTPTRAT